MAALLLDIIPDILGKMLLMIMERPHIDMNPTTGLSPFVLRLLIGVNVKGAGRSFPNTRYRVTGTNQMEVFLRNVKIASLLVLCKIVPAIKKPISLALEVMPHPSFMQR